MAASEPKSNSLESWILNGIYYFAVINMTTKLVAYNVLKSFSLVAKANIYVN